jgi:hypothetical protein
LGVVDELLDRGIDCSGSSAPWRVRAKGISVFK